MAYLSKGEIKFFDLNKTPISSIAAEAMMQYNGMIYTVSNGQLIETMATYARQAGREVASPAEARRRPKCLVQQRLGHGVGAGGLLTPSRLGRTAVPPRGWSL